MGLGYNCNPHFSLSLLHLFLSQPHARSLTLSATPHTTLYSWELQRCTWWRTLPQLHMSTRNGEDGVNGWHLPKCQWVLKGSNYGGEERGHYNCVFHCLSSLLRLARLCLGRSAGLSSKVTVSDVAPISWKKQRGRWQECKNWLKMPNLWMGRNVLFFTRDCDDEIAM